MRTQHRVALIGAALLSTLAYAQAPVFKFRTEGESPSVQTQYRRLENVINNYQQQNPLGADLDGDVSIWCRDVISIINRAERRANDYYASDRIVQAATEFRAGLVKAQEHLSGRIFRSSVTAKTVWYGNVLATRMLAPAQRSETNMRTYSLFFSEYYKLVRRAYELDNTFSFAYGNCYDCSSNRLREYEEKLVSLAQSELKVVLDGLLVNGGPPTPLGSSDGAMYLTAMTLTTAFSADLLGHSPYRNSYACIIGELLTIHDLLANGGYSGPVEAVEETAYEVAGIIPRIQFHSCWGGSWNPADAPGRRY